MRQGTYIATYHKWECPYCGTKNIILGGDVTDLTIPDVEEFDCLGCDRTFGCDPDYEGE